MALSIFKAFRSTVTPPNVRPITSVDRLLVDPVTGAPIGLQNPDANGPDARFTPVDVTPAQVLAPTVAMIADIDATYRLSVVPYARYRSDGTQLVPADGSGTEVVVPPGFNVIYYAPLTIAFPQELIVQGQARVESFPA